jgi:hypothetical protein
MVTPLAAERHKLQFTISRETHEKLRSVQALGRHLIPSGDPAEIFDRALTLLLQDLERRRCAAVTSPRAARETVGGSRHIPASVKREVWRRDEGRCAYIGRAGASGWWQFQRRLLKRRWSLVAYPRRLLARVDGTSAARENCGRGMKRVSAGRSAFVMGSSDCCRPPMRR